MENRADVEEHRRLPERLLEQVDLAGKLCRPVRGDEPGLEVGHVDSRYVPAATAEVSRYGSDNTAHCFRAFGSEVQVLAWAADDAMCLGGIAAHQSQPEGLADRKSIRQEAAMMFGSLIETHTAIAASSGITASQLPRTPRPTILRSIGHHKARRSPFR